MSLLELIVSDSNVEVPVVSQDGSEVKDFFEKIKGWSKVKHDILQRYFNAWLPIMCQSGQQAVYIDGFAGPGYYKSESGNDPVPASPVIAYEAAAKHSHRSNFKTQLLMYFIEKDEKRAQALASNLAQARARIEAEIGPINHVVYLVQRDSFSDRMQRILEIIRNTQISLFVYVDPFGYKGSTIPMTLMQSIIERVDYAATEIFINIMDGFAARFFNLDQRARAINELVGTDTWKAAISGLESKERLDKFVAIYVEQLTKYLQPGQCRHLPFTMKNSKNSHLYHLLFITRHPAGIKAMKDAMWKKSQSYFELEYSQFIVGKEGRPDLSKLPDAEWKQKMAELIIGPMLLKEFGGKGPVRGKVLKNYIEYATIFKFNVRVQLKKNFKQYVFKPSSKFDNILFLFPAPVEDQN